MTLTSFSFFVFVFCSMLVYYLVPQKRRWIVLLTSSVLFYAIVCLKYVVFIILTSITTYYGAIFIFDIGEKRRKYIKEHKSELSKEERNLYKKRTKYIKKWMLFFVLAINFGILCFLKYYNFAMEIVSGWMGMTFPALNLFLPLGISFYTFQSMGYIIDVFWEKTEPQRNYAKLALFVSFFPQIIQGPIAIYDDLADQLFRGNELREDNLKYGFQLFLWGLFKKMVIADRLIVAINSILPQKSELSDVYYLLVLLMYSIQLYMDFSGGIDVSRGIALLFGITMAENFKRPYFSKNTTEFWHRWHASLGNWMRTYLFYPLALSPFFLAMTEKISAIGKKVNLKKSEDELFGSMSFWEHLGVVLPGCIGTFVIFLVIGIWHGAEWKYIGFGLWNGIVISLSMFFEPWMKWILRKLKIRTESFSWILLQIICTYMIMMVGFVFDIADGFRDGILMVAHCIAGGFDLFSLSKDKIMSFGLEGLDYFIIFVGVMIVFCVSLYQELSGKMVRDFLDKQCFYFQWIVTLSAIFIIVIFGMYGFGYDASAFVYMQF